MVVDIISDRQQFESFNPMTPCESMSVWYRRDSKLRDFEQSVVITQIVPH